MWIKSTAVWDAERKLVSSRFCCHLRSDIFTSSSTFVRSTQAHFGSMVNHILHRCSTVKASDEIVIFSQSIFMAVALQSPFSPKKFRSVEWDGEINLKDSVESITTQGCGSKNQEWASDNAEQKKADWRSKPKEIGSSASLSCLSLILNGMGIWVDVWIA